MHCLLASCTDPAVCGYSAIPVGQDVNHVQETCYLKTVVVYRRTLEAVTLSLGTAGFPAQRPTMDAVLKTADATLYRAKRDGRNRIVAAD